MFVGVEHFAAVDWTAAHNLRIVAAAVVGRSRIDHNLAGHSHFGSGFAAGHSLFDHILVVHILAGRIEGTRRTVVGIRRIADIGVGMTEPQVGRIEPQVQRRCHLDETKVVVAAAVACCSCSGLAALFWQGFHLEHPGHLPRNRDLTLWVQSVVKRLRGLRE